MRYIPVYSHSSSEPVQCYAASSWCQIPDAFLIQSRHLENDSSARPSMLHMRRSPSANLPNSQRRTGPVAVRGQKPVRRACTACSAFLLSSGANVDKHDALASTPVLRVSDGSDVRLTELWGAEEMCVVVFARSFGCPFCQCDFVLHSFTTVAICTHFYQTMH